MWRNTAYHARSHEIAFHYDDDGGFALVLRPPFSACRSNRVGVPSFGWISPRGGGGLSIATATTATFV